MCYGFCDGFRDGSEVAPAPESEEIKGAHCSGIVVSPKVAKIRVRKSKADCYSL